MNLFALVPRMIPFAKPDGVAEHTGEFLAALATRHRVVAITPLDPDMDLSRHPLARRIKPIEVRIGDRTRRFRILEADLPTRVHAVLLEPEPRVGEGYDLLEPWAWFARAAFSYQSETPKDALLVFGWRTGIACRDKPAALPSLVVVHDPADDGRFPSDQALALGLEPGAGNGEYSGLRQALSSCDAAIGLDPAGPFLHVPPGINTLEWNPSTDRALPLGFGPKDLRGKRRAKAEAQYLFGLDIDPSIPLFVLPASGEDRQGVQDAIASMVTAPAQVVVMNEPDPEAGPFGALMERFPDRVHVTGALEPPHRKLLLAAADFAVFRHWRADPTGPLKALCFGAVVVIDDSPGFPEPVVDMDPEGRSGTGFVYDGRRRDGLHAALERARAFFHHDGGLMDKAREQALSLDLGWERPLLLMDEILQGAVKNKTGAAS